MTRVLGIDLGSRRIGVAVSDPSGTLATPLTVLERGADRHDDHEAIVATAREAGATRIVVGVPRSLSGDTGPAARAAAAEIAELRAVAGDTLPVDEHDERFTTVIATRRLREAGARRVGDRGGARRGAAAVDAAAAAEILQSYLDRAARPQRAP